MHAILCVRSVRPFPTAALGFSNHNGIPPEIAPDLSVERMWIAGVGGVKASIRRRALRLQPSFGARAASSGGGS